MKHFNSILLILTCLGVLGFAQEEKSSICKDDGFYIKIGSGASFPTTAHVNASADTWDPAIQGYNSKLGTAPVFLTGLGYDSPYVSGEFSASYRPNYSYSKFQIPSTTNTTGQLGIKTRRFDLDVTSLMFSLYLNGRGFEALKWKAGDGCIFPFIGAGIGVSQMKVFNFRSTGLPPYPSNSTLASFSSDNEYAVDYRFTYQLMTGLEYRFKDVFALSLGYRWFKPSRFDGPSYFRRSNGSAFQASNPWKISFGANEAFLELKVLL
jgi:opacity protein-like surface antigen